MEVINCYKGDVNINKGFFIAKCERWSSPYVNSTRGENAEFLKELKNSYVFKTESGIIIKTSKYNLRVYGKHTYDYVVLVGRKKLGEYENFKII